MRRVIRFLAVLILSFWLGGIAFYGSLVVPTAHQILDSHREIGFVTRSITGTANWIGVAALALLLTNLLTCWRDLSRGGRISLAASFGVMAVAQVVLFILRSYLDSMLDPTAMRILDRPRFMPLHERYLNATSILCLAGLVHLWAIIPPPKPQPVLPSSP